MFGVPDEKLPDFCRDEQRVNVLFAPLRSRQANPKDWETKISHWKICIRAYCEANKVYSFTLSSFTSVFVRNGRPPSCLKEVLEDMKNNGEIQLLEIFLRRNKSTWSGWATDVLIKRPLLWSYNKLKGSITLNKTEETYVHLELVKSQSEELLKRIPEKMKNRVVTLKELVNLLENQRVENIKLLLHYLENTQQISVAIDNGKDQLESLLIKFGDGHKVSPISEADMGIHTLEKNETILTKQLEALEDEIEDIVKEAKVQLTKKHRQMAKNLLRKKHELEKRIEKKSNALLNVQTILENVKDSNTNADVLEAYKNAVTAFNNSTKTQGMTEDAVEDTMIELGDVMEIHNNIQSALASRPVADDSNDEDLEKELEELLVVPDDDNFPNDGGQITDLSKQMEDLSLNLPSVPNDSPVKQQEDSVSVEKQEFLN
ncbi:unnamed protein product [Acanthoscelides obtectus]|uniref:Charged multivesicular body protein 7 n=1 Tax=Acanthoscelides obtectus TaxID=200917 RepID=A0A9P0NTZ8_ACAOB|nr:unnamed protein product [Acanthoscelides obtectus]CAK1650017.1 Charged multivesicular body protein 7 [Acanthoscelides obtectus]